jgi:lipopolysaccharide biosynthesis glycosyltransferase
VRETKQTEIHAVPMPTEQLEGLLRSRAIPRAAYARLLIGGLLPTHVTRLIYLDSDLLVCRDLRELWRTDLGGRVLGAVPNSLDPAADVSAFDRLGVAGKRYFNSGVLLIDLMAWRTEEVGERALAFARALGDRLILHDQDALNAVLVDRWVELPGYWNHWASRDASVEAAVIHFTMPPKPWDADYSGPFRAEYFEVLDRTAWNGWRPPRWLGMAARISRIRRTFPYVPTVWRRFRRLLSGRVRGDSFYD